MKTRSILPDPKTNPDAHEYAVIDTEQDGVSAGRKYGAGTITRIGPRDYIGIPTQPAQALRPGQAVPLMQHDQFPDVQSAADSFPEGTLPYIA
jgi:hypothetical protein